MNGHTSNNQLAVCLASKMIRAQQEADRRTDVAGKAYHEGAVAAAREIAILLYVDNLVDEILERNQK